jgi:hypothetical protein
VAAQFFNNDGVPLAGGLINTYAAGTNTPANTYTTSAGTIPHSNPIVLDSAGRVPTGEIWLTDGLAYKFVLKDSTGALLATYDNIVGINSNFVNYTASQEIQTATAGQTVFTLTTMTYQPGTNSLSVFVDGVNQYGPGASYAFTETSSTSVTFASGLHVGASVKFTTAQINSSVGQTAAQTSFTGFKSQTGTVQDLADDDGSDWIGFKQAGTNAVAHSAQDKMRETVSVFDFMTAAQIADVQAGTYTLDTATAIGNAINSGATNVMFPPGSYRMNSGIVITSSTAVRNVIGSGLVTLKLYTAVQSSIFEVQPGKQFLYFKNFVLTSNGTAGDGLQTYGILSISNAYTKFDDIRASNFSGAGLELRQCVYSGINNYTAQSCFYGLSFQKYLTVQCTAVEVNRVYISGCTRGVTQDGAVDMIYTGLVMEYCGSTTTVDGALHLTGGTAVFDFPYFEANYRNIVAVDAQATIRNIYGDGTGTAADSITYVGTAFNERGWDVSFGYKHTMARLNDDTYTQRDLVIGTNLTVPLAGGSVIFGNETMASASGTLTSATWTTVYTIPAAEVTGTNVNALAMYEYTCYAGSADKSTGFDSGTIMNGTLRSYSGTTPAWLRLSSNLVQMNVTNVTYGLTYKIVMRRVYPG